MYYSSNFQFVTNNVEKFGLYFFGSLRRMSQSIRGDRPLRVYDRLSVNMTTVTSYE